MYKTCNLYAIKIDTKCYIWVSKVINFDEMTFFSAKKRAAN